MRRLSDRGDVDALREDVVTSGEVQVDRALFEVEAYGSQAAVVGDALWHEKLWGKRPPVPRQLLAKELVAGLGAQLNYTLCETGI